MCTERGELRGRILTPLVVRGSSRSMCERNSPGWLLTASALRDADIVAVDIW